MDAIKIQGTPRGTGKSAARALRREGRVPCVLYGARVDSVAFATEVNALNPLIYTDETPIVQVEVEGETYDCVMKEVTFDPVRDIVRHADFQVLTAGEAITITVPIQFTGTPVGQLNGGDTQTLIHDLVVRCLPKDIPSSVDIDISHLDIGDTIHVRDLKIEGVSFVTLEDQTIVTVVAPRVDAALLEEEEAAAEDAEGATDEAADEAGDASDDA